MVSKSNGSQAHVDTTLDTTDVGQVHHSESAIGQCYSNRRKSQYTGSKLESHRRSNKEANVAKWRSRRETGHLGREWMRDQHTQSLSQVLSGLYDVIWAGQSVLGMCWVEEQHDLMCVMPESLWLLFWELNKRDQRHELGHQYDNTGRGDDSLKQTIIVRSGKILGLCWCKKKAQNHLGSTYHNIDSRPPLLGIMIELNYHMTHESLLFSPVQILVLSHLVSQYVTCPASHKTFGIHLFE